MFAPACSSRFRQKSASDSRQDEKSPAPKPVRSTRFSHSAGMIWSVSTSLRSSGTAVPVMMRTGSISSLLLEVGGGGEGAADRRGGGDGRGDEVGPAARPLSALEVAVRGGG